MIWISHVSLRSLSLMIWITHCCYPPHLKERKRGRDDIEEHLRELVHLWAGFGGQPRYMCVKCRRTYEWIFSHFISTVGRELPIAAHFVRWKMRSAHVSQHLMFLRICLKSRMLSAHMCSCAHVLKNLKSLSAPMCSSTSYVLNIFMFLRVLSVLVPRFLNILCS